jgi:hypothetical protein
MKDRRSPGKTFIVPVALTLIMMLCSFGLVQDELIMQNEQKVEINKKDVMLNILESLESGKPYFKNEIWKGSNYAVIELPAIELPDFSDFDFDFDFNFELPEFDFDELEFKELELRMEELQKKIDIRMQDMIRRIESMHEKHFEKFEIEI